MKIYSNTLTTGAVREAFLLARMFDGQDIWIESIRAFHPRKYGANGTEVYAESLNGNRATGRNQAHQGRAASWTAWGYVIARLFARDPQARISWYGNAQDFADQVRKHTPRGESTGFLSLLGEEIA